METTRSLTYEFETKSICTVGFQGSNSDDNQRQTKVNRSISLPHPCSISINMPDPPSGFPMEQIKRVIVTGRSVPVDVIQQQGHSALSPSVNARQSKHGNLQSQPIHPESAIKSLKRISSMPAMKDKRYDSFKTWSGRLERQISNLRGKPQESGESGDSEIIEIESVPSVERYFDALEGPELDTLRVCDFWLVFLPSSLGQSIFLIFLLIRLVPPNLECLMRLG